MDNGFRDPRHRARSKNASRQKGLETAIVDGFCWEIVPRKNRSVDALCASPVIGGSGIMRL